MSMVSCVFRWLLCIAALTIGTACESNQLLLPDDDITRSHLLVNSYTYIRDHDNYGKEDYWATPEETILRESGDCEDFAILKMKLFLEHGIPQENLRLGYVVVGKTKEAHIVLYHSYDAGFHEAKTLVYDSLTDRVDTLEERRDIVPIYSLSPMGVFKDTIGSRSRTLGPLKLLAGSEAYRVVSSAFISF